MPAPAVRVQLKVRDGTHRSRVVKPGDTVHILQPVGEWQLDEISAFPPPHIVDIQRQKGGGRRGNQYELKVQFQTKDKQTHQAMFTPSQLEASKAAFLIGDEVIVQRSIKPLVVPVNTTGVIVGGDGDFYHVSFALTDYHPPVTVSQDFVPAEALTYSTRKRHPRGASKLEKSSASIVNVVLPPEEQVHTTEQKEEEEGEEGIQDDEPSLPEPPPLLAKAACHLQPHMFDKFKQWVSAQHNNQVESSAHLQGLLVQFLRQQVEPVRVTVNPAVMIALREVGASTDDVARLVHTPKFHTLTVQEAIKRYFSL